jgi:4-hydroxybutyrate dehydrogenase
MAFIYYVTQIQFDFGAIKLLKQECDRVGISKPLIITDQGVKAAGILQKALDQLPNTIQPNRGSRARCCIALQGQWL